MGNQNARNCEKLPFTPKELKVLEDSYKAIAAFNVARHLSAEKLLQAWLTFIDPYLAQCTSNYILKNNQSCIALKRFAEPYYIVEHGTRDEKLEFLSSCLDKGGSMKFTIQELENYVASVIRSFILIQSKLKSNNFESWTKNGYYSTESSLVSLAKNLTRNLVLNAGNCVDLSKLEHWLDRNPLFLILWREVFTKLYSFKAGQHTTLDRELSTVVIPVIEGLNDESNYAPLLDIPHIIFLNNNFHNERRHKWRFLFSSKVMGESFSTMLTKITNKGPTLLIIEDEDHYIFAGYAPASWSLSPLFVGDDTSMLFTLSPDMRCFSSSGYNDHYQYLNLNQKTMPNGLGMGGQLNYWGLWIDCEYGKGESNESCTTYRDYIQLSKRKDFKIRNLEVFGIGDKLEKDKDGEDNYKRSVLERNLEDRVLLELSGKHMNSEGVREPDMDF